MSNGSPGHEALPDEDEILSEELQSRIFAFDEAMARGEAASMADGHALAGITDEQREQVEGILQCLRFLDRARHQGAPGTDSSAHPELVFPSAAQDSIESQFRIGRFEIIREIGRGGHGVVFLAKDTALNRQVAVKVPRPEFVMTSNIRRRFVREARSAAGLSHENILRVYEVGETGPICHIVQELCTGPSLKQWLSEQKQPVSARTAAVIIRELAHGVQHAHSWGVGHRDIKPGNVLLQPRSLGEDKPRNAPGDRISAKPNGGGDLFPYTPKLADFGIAKILDSTSEETVTLTGVIIGTAAYMAPEQAAAKRSLIGPQTDIYALGVILYELLTGQPPFSADSNLALLRCIIDDEPKALRLIRRDVPQDLEAICLKCLEKSPESRYATAENLATDLRLFLDGLPVHARRQSMLKRTARRIRRILSASPFIVIGSLFAIMVMVVLAWGYWNTTRGNRAIVADLESHARFRKESLVASYGDDIRQAAELWELAATQQRVNVGVGGEMERVLSSHIPSDDQNDHRGLEWHYLWGFCHPQDAVPKMAMLRAFNGHTGTVYHAAFSPDGRFLLTAGEDKTARMWNLETGEAMCVFKGHDDDVNRVAMSPSSELIATSSDDRTVRLWRPTGEPVATLSGHNDWVSEVAFSPDSKRLASADWHGNLKIWDLSQPGTFPVLSAIEVKDDGLVGVRFSTDGRWLLTYSGKAVRVLHANDFRPFVEYSTTELGLPAGYAAFDNRNQSLAIVGTVPGRGGRVAIKSLAPGAIWSEFASGEQFRSVCFSPGDDMIFTAQPDRGVILWDVATHQHWNPLEAPYRNYWHVALSPDGTKLAAVGLNAQVHLFDARNQSHVAALLDRDVYHPTMTFDSSGAIIALGVPEFPLQRGTGPLTADLWEAPGVAETLSLKTTIRVEGALGGLSISPDGKYLAVDIKSAHGSFIRLLDRQSLDEFANYEWPTSAITSRTFAPESRIFRATAISQPAGSSTMRSWDVPSGRESPALTLIGGDLEPPQAVASSKDGRWIAAVNNRQVDVFEIPGLRRVWSTVLTNEARCSLAFSSDGRLLAIGNLDISLYDTLTWQRKHVIPVPFRAEVPAAPARETNSLVSHMVFSPDGTRLVAAHEADPRPALWSVEAGELLMRLPPARTAVSRIRELHFSPDGQAICAAVTDEQDIGNIYIWNSRYANPVSHNE